MKEFLIYISAIGFFVSGVLVGLSFHSPSINILIPIVMVIVFWFLLKCDW